MSSRIKIWSIAAPGALFVASAVGAGDVLVVSAAGGVAGVGAVAVVALFVPGSLLGRVAVIPQGRPA